MYYLYKKSKAIAVPRFTYTFKDFNEFYNVAEALTMSLVDAYNIRVKCDSYKEVAAFIDKADSYTWLTIYVETSQSVLDYIVLRKPSVSLLTSKSNYETFEELISRYGILFDKGCIQILYSAIDHDYTDMVDALELIKQEYPNAQKITKAILNELFVIDDFVYPRSVCISYIRMDRWRRSRAVKSINSFGNDLVLYAMRKNVNLLLEEKIKYLKTGKGSGLIKTLPVDNIVKLYNALHGGRGSFMDVLTILDLYEKGETINDTLQKRTLSPADA